MGKNLYVLIGNIAAGKSTWVNNYREHSYVVSRDIIRYEFGDGDYLFDYELEPCIDKIVKGQTEGCMVLGNDLIIDETQMTKKSRAWVLALGKKYGYTITGLVFPDRGMESHVEARLGDNHGSITRGMWESIYTRKQEAFEYPDVSEGFSVVIDL